MRIQLALLLLSSVLVYGCVQQSEDSQTPRRSEFVTTRLASIDQVQNAQSTQSNREPALHVVKLNGYCPSDLLVKGEDVVKFVNLSQKPVEITGLNSRGKRAASDDTVGVPRLSNKDRIGLGRRLGGPAKSGFFEVNSNPFKGEYLIFHYQVSYNDTACVDDPMKGQHFWSVPPTMIVGPDTL